MKEIVIASAVRTPIGAFTGAFQNISAIELGEIAIRAALERAGVKPENVDEVIMGNVLQAGLGQGPARQAAVRAGVPYHVPATTVNKLCGSGLKAIIMAAQAIHAGDAELIVAGGMENMTQAPYLLPQGRTGYRFGDGALVDSMTKDGLTCAISGLSMGSTAENIAVKYEISREEQDAFALESQHKTEEASSSLRFNDELVPVHVQGRKGQVTVVERDEHPRSGITAEQLAKLKPVYAKDGTVTPGNASGINDGAAAVVVCSRERADQLGLTPIARLRGYAYTGIDPAYMGLGPISAIRQALSKANLTIQDLDLIELNEAFAAQAIAVMRELSLDPGKVNVNGGAIALGHPIGASGARITATLLHEMRRRESNLGLAALCVGGGHGIAAVFENI